MSLKDSIYKHHKYDNKFSFKNSKILKKKKKTEKGNVDKIVREGVQKTLNPLSCRKTCG